MAVQDLTQLSRGAALLLLLGGPGVLVLRGGGWLGYLLYAVYILTTLALFDRIRDRWRAGGRAGIWFDLAAAGLGALFCVVFLVQGLLVFPRSSKYTEPTSSALAGYGDAIKHSIEFELQPRLTTHQAKAILRPQSVQRDVSLGF